MAHRLERRALRSDRNGAGRRHSALRSAALLILLVARASAGQPAAYPAISLWTGDPHLEAWLARPGNGLWNPLVGFNLSPPVSWAGHVLAPMAIENRPFPGPGVPWPGPLDSRVPCEWADTVTVTAMPGSAWEGWAPGAVRTVGQKRLQPPGHTDAVISLRGGSFSRSEHSLVFARDDSLWGLSYGAQDRHRNPADPLGNSGDHIYSATAHALVRGQRIAGSYRNFGSAAALQSGSEEHAEGESGQLAWRSRMWGRPWALDAGRGRDVQQSLGRGPDSRRESQAWWADAAWGAADSAGWSARATWQDGRVVRLGGDGFGARSADEWWVSARRGFDLAHGPLSATLGAGDNSGAGAFQVAPQLEWAPRSKAWGGTLWVGRAVQAVWSDLAPGVPPFIEDTWQGGASARWRDPEKASGAEIAVVTGRTGNRAIVARRPLEEEWLRPGIAGSPGYGDFGLARVTAARRGPGVDAGISGEAVSMDQSPLQAQVDPLHRGLAWLEGHLTLFGGDLGVRVRGEVEGVGPRETDEALPRRLPGYATLAGSIQLTLGDAMLVVRGLDLTDERAEQVWIDESKGLPARSPGRELQIAFYWRLFD